MISLKSLAGTLSLSLALWCAPAVAYPANTTSVQGPRLVAQLGHADKVTSVAFSPDGRYVLTSSSDLSARLWLTETGQELRIFRGHTSWVNAVAFSPNGHVVITGSQDGTARLWSIESGDEVRRFEYPYPIQSVAFSPDGRLVATGSLDGLVRLWSSESGREVRRLVGHLAAVNSVAFSPDGRYLLTGSGSYQRDDNTARLWSVETGQELRRFGKHASFINAVSFFSRGDSVLTACEDGSVRLWSLGSGTELMRFEGHSHGVKSVAFSPDGSNVFTAGGLDWTVRKWSKDSGKEIRRYLGHIHLVTSVVSSPDGRYLLTGSWDQTAWLWDADSGKELHRFGKQVQTVSSVKYSPNGQYILVSGDVLARLWDLSNGRMVRHFKGHTVDPNTQIMSQLVCSFSPDGKYIFTSSQERISRLWSADSGLELRRFNIQPNFVSAVAFSTDGRYLATGERPYGPAPGGTIRLWSVKGGTELRRFDGHSDDISSLAFSPNEALLLTGSMDKTTRLWSVESGKELKRFDDVDPVTAVAFSLDGRYLVTIAGKTARLRSVKTGEEVRRFQEPRDTLWSVAFSPDGGQILFGTGPWENTAVLYAVETGDRVCRYAGHSGNVTSVAFSPDGKCVVTGSWDNTARLWERKSGRELGRLISLVDNSWVVVTPDGRFDTDNLEEIKGLHWIMPDDPLRPLPVEIFMRDYYEPRLLPRVLAGERLPAIRSLAELNRVQPKVEIARVAPEDVRAGTVTVTVEVSAASGTLSRDGKTVTKTTGVYGLRLFRDGQLVAQMPSLAYEPSGAKTSEEELIQWRRTHEITLDPKTGKKALTFRGIRLPRRTGLKDVEFSAYAFNEDRVKSSTARAKFPIPKDLPARQGNAYVVTVGVNAYESSDWDLRYAAKDAQFFSDVVNPLLEKSQNYREVVSVQLLSDWTVDQSGKRTITVSDATKAMFRAVLDLLAGREVRPALRSGIPNADKLELVQPEDLVLIAFSSHGYADQSGVFYLFPYDIGSYSGKKVTSGLLKRTISSDELSAWLRDIDAGELVMIIDACHSAASVEGAGFKPGPMGARGLGQLAYDKGMRILASTRADDVAWESALTQQGLLSYALIRNGLVKKQADFDPQDKRILLSEWLKYGVRRVPELYEEVRSGQVKGAEEKDGRLTVYRRGVEVDYDAEGEKSSEVQQPSLFDFRRAVSYEPLITRLEE